MMSIPAVRRIGLALRLLPAAMLVFSLLAGCSWQMNNHKPTSTPTALIPPTDTMTALPDLVVENVYYDLVMPPDGVCNSPSDLIRLHVVVVNRGNLAAGPFTVQADDAFQAAPSGLKPGDQINLTFAISNTLPQIRVDAASLVNESDETNNRFSRLLELPALPAACLATPTPQILYLQPKLTLEGHTASVLTVAFAPDGGLAASGSVDNTVRLWAVEEGRLLRTMQGHSFPILCLKFTPNGSQLVTGSMDGLLRAWQVANSGLLRTMRGHAGWIASLDISPNGQFVVSGSDDFTVRIWRLSNASLMQTIDEGMAEINSVVFSSDSTRIAWAEANGVVRVRTLAGEWRLVLKGTSLSATSVIFSPQDDWLAAGYANGSIRIWRVSDGVLLALLKDHIQAITSLAVSPDGRWLVSASKDSTLRLWSIQSGDFARTPSAMFIGHEKSVNDVDFSPQGNLIISGSEDGTVRLWEIPAQIVP
jgi:hypothetical protein